MIHTETQGAVDVVKVDGTLNAEKIGELAQTLERLTKAGAPMVVCDLAHTQLVDSDGLEWLLDASDQVASCGGTIKLSGLSPLVADILRLTGVAERFEIFETAKAGVGSFSR
ncbi:STAS domain-containing protein [Aeoliella sp.]|uniref:STAS domain-containing protein n=1 Tax=Aeoliella sp. TaxID=2795800 RepID=UPI003CCC2637